MKPFHFIHCEFVELINFNFIKPCQKSNKRKEDHFFDGHIIVYIEQLEPIRNSCRNSKSKKRNSKS